MRTSKIFGEKELDLLEKRTRGQNKDPTGLWSRTTKHKVKEILIIWLPRIKELEKTLIDKRRNIKKRTG